MGLGAWLVYFARFFVFVFASIKSSYLALLQAYENKLFSGMREKDEWIREPSR